MLPVQPKKPVGGAYGAYLSEKRPEFATACVGKKACEVSKMAGAEWKKLSEEQKAVYQKKFLEKKGKYAEDMKDFLEKGGTKAKGVRALRSQRKREKNKTKQTFGKKMNANVPKKPAGGGYGQYLAENREEIKKSLPPKHKITDVSKAAAAKWRSLSPYD